jgi:hypothetical protein
MAIKNRAARLAAWFPETIFSRILISMLVMASVAYATGNTDSGVSCTNDVVPSVPWSIHVVRIDRACRNVRFCTTLGGGGVLGMGIVSDQVKAQPAGHTCFWIDAGGNPQMTNIVSRFRVIWPNGKTTPLEMNVERTSGMAVLYTAILGPSTLTDSGIEYVLERSPGHEWLPLHAGRIYAVRVRRISPATAAK